MSSKKAISAVLNQKNLFGTMKLHEIHVALFEKISHLILFHFVNFSKL